MSDVIIAGMGITGCTAALELAGLGLDVDMVESSAGVGGKVTSYCCKATDECSRCGVCVAHTAIADALRHPRIRALDAATIVNARNDGSRVSVEASRRQPEISHRRCTACGACVEACPAHCISTYSRGGLEFVSIDHSRCLRHKQRKCTRCVAACPRGAVSADGRARDLRLSARAALIATGHKAYDPTAKPSLGYGRLRGVITAEQAERMLSTGKALDGDPASVAFVQCVGSRDPEICRNYCSSVCCAYAVRMARVIKHNRPATDVTLYFIDLQNFDKTFAGLRRKIVAEGVKFVRAVPFSIDATGGGRLRLKTETGNGAHGTAEHDAVVLSVGVEPAPDASRTAGLFGLARDEYGFFASGHAGIVFAAGTCVEPQSIPQAMSSAKAAAAQIAKLLKARTPPATKTLHGHGAPARKRFALSSEVLVIGGGAAGAHTARELADFGYRTTLVERSERAGGDLVRSDRANGDFAGLLKGVNVLTASRVEKLSGNIGAFAARIVTPDGAKDLKAGAVVLCTGANGAGKTPADWDSDVVTGVADLPGVMTRLARKDRPRSVGIVLDLEAEETKASMEMALRCSLDLRAKYACDLTVFCREVRVSATHLQALYDKARDAGVNIVKYDGKLSIELSEQGALVKVRDCVLGEGIAIACQLVGLSPYSRAPGADSVLSGTTGVSLDSAGQLQDNNLHLFPGLTNRPGIFVVGACRGQYYVPELEADARATALGVHALLSRRHLDVELDNAVVDADKCALCLTCVRSCPHGAMAVDAAKRSAVSLPEVCRKCGICAGECPAGAIELPGSEAVAAVAPPAARSGS